MFRYLLYWTDTPPERQLATFDSDRLAPMIEHGLRSQAPFEVRLGKRIVARWRGAGEVEYLENKGEINNV